MVYAKIEDAYYSTWRLLFNTYKNTFPKKVDYLYNTCLFLFRPKFINCYLDKIRHYRNVVTSQIEDCHILLKSKLEISMDDLFTIVTNINSLLWNQHQEYIIALGEVKNNTPMILKSVNNMIYQDLTPYITLFILLKIYK